MLKKNKSDITLAELIKSVRKDLLEKKKDYLQEN